MRRPHIVLNALVKPYSKATEEFIGRPRGRARSTQTNGTTQRSAATSPSANGCSGRLLAKAPCLRTHRSQGSFRLGTVIRPVNENEDYDVDAVCELSADRTQLHAGTAQEGARGSNLRRTPKSRGMKQPSERKKRRCWRLDYSRRRAIPYGRAARRFQTHTATEEAIFETCSA